MTTVTSDKMGNARIVTRSKTFVKHAFTFDQGVATVSRAKVEATLTDVTAAYSSPGVLRLEGTNTDGQPEVWRVDNLGCGCRNIVQVLDTAEEDVPT